MDILQDGSMSLDGWAVCLIQLFRGLVHQWYFVIFWEPTGPLMAHIKFGRCVTMIEAGGSSPKMENDTVI
jgi:hypothetical protein